MSNQLLALEQAHRILRRMENEANELGVTGVAEVTSVPLILELSMVSEEELADLSELSLAALVSEISQGNTSFATIPTLQKIVGKMVREPDPIGRGPNDSGTNYSGFVGGKIAQMLRTGANSGANGSMKGESPARGGVILDQAAAAFSGGSETQDVQIAEAGLQIGRQYIWELSGKQYGLFLNTETDAYFFMALTVTVPDYAKPVSLPEKYRVDASGFFPKLVKKEA